MFGNKYKILGKIIVYNCWYGLWGCVVVSWIVNFVSFVIFLFLWCCLYCKNVKWRNYNLYCLLLEII